MPAGWRRCASCGCRRAIGARYTLREGPLAEVLFAHTADMAALEAALAPYSSGTLVWKQWLSPRGRPLAKRPEASAKLRA